MAPEMIYGAVVSIVIFAGSERSDVVPPTGVNCR